MERRDGHVTPAVSALCAPIWGRIGYRFGFLSSASLIGSSISPVGWSRRGASKSCFFRCCAAARDCRNGAVGHGRESPLSRARRRWTSRRYSSILCLCFRWRHGRFFLSSCTPPVCRGSGTRGRERGLAVVRRGRLMTATILTVTLDASTSTNNRACCAGRPCDERAASR